MRDLPTFPSDLSLLDRRLADQTARGTVDSGLAQRIRLSARLHGGIYPPPYGGETAEHGGRTRDRDGTEAGGALSGESLGQALGLSRAAVNKHVRQLREHGFAVASAAGTGYRLTAPADDLLVPEAVLPYILGSMDPERPWCAGVPYMYRESCESTNQTIRRALSERSDLPAGAVAVTDHQSAGRGRLGRGWSDEAGKEVMFSVLLRPLLAPAQAQLLSLAAALAVARTLEALPGLEDRVGVKWPNDVLVDGGKVCGILLEGSMDTDRLHWAVAGIGVNVNSDPAALESAIAAQDDEGRDARPRPVSLRERLGRSVPRAPLLAALLAELTEVWSGLEAGRSAVDELMVGIGRLDALAGRPVEVRGGPGRPEVIAVGQAAGLGPEGELLVRTDGGDVIPVTAGDVTVNPQTDLG